MAQKMQVVKELVSRGRSEGMDKVAADLNKVADAQDNVAKSGETASKSTDTTAKRQISAAAAYDRLLKSIDETYRGQQQFARGQGVLDRALEQGKIDATEYARALDLLKSKYLDTPSTVPSIMPRGSNDNIKMASHEVSNLNAQIQDIGVSLAGGQNPFTVMIQQGSQISNLMGNRGLTSIFTGLGTALASMVNPTMLVLAGFTALYIGATYAYSAIQGDSKSVEDGLKEQERLLKIVEGSYDNVAGAANRWQNASRAATVVETTKALADMKKQMDDLSKRFLEGGAFSGGAGQYFLQSDPNLGDKYNFKARKEYAAFASPLEAFESSGKTTDDINKLVDAIGRIGQANPALQDAAAKLLDMARGSGDANKSMTEAADGVRKLEAQLRVLAGTATDADLTILKLADSAKDIASAAKLIEDLKRDGARIGDDQAQAIGRTLDRLGSGATMDQRREAYRLAQENFEKEKAARDAEKRSQEGERDAKKAERDLKREAQRVWDDTRNSAEAYADQIKKLNDLLEQGAISQDTYARAAAKAKEEMSEKQVSDRLKTLSKSSNPYDGIELGIAEYTKSVGTLAEQTAQITQGLFKGMEDAFVEFVTTGKLNFQDLANSMIADMARVAAKQAIAGIFGLGGQGGAGGVGGLLSGLMGSFGGGAGGGLSSFGGVSAALGGIYHSGGVGTEPNYNRLVPSSVFVGAPKLHSGHDPLDLLSAGEKPAIIKEDEGVFTAGQMKAMGARMNAPANINVNVHALPGSTAEVQQKQNPDGSISLDIIMKQVVSALKRDVESNGSLAKTLQGGYGLKRAMR